MFLERCEIGTDEYMMQLHTRIEYERKGFGWYSTYLMNSTIL
jgi:hypothetical protein